MRGDIIYQVFGIHEGREKDVYLGAFRTREEAEAEGQRLSARLMNGSNWSRQCHNKGFVIREKVVTTSFEIPALPKPRDKYFVSPSAIENGMGRWNSTRVEVFRRSPSGSPGERVGEYVRNYAMLQTFEPFRQEGREFALISRH